MIQITREEAITRLVADDIATIHQEIEVHGGSEYLQQILKWYWKNDAKETLEDELYHRFGEEEHKITG